MSAVQGNGCDDMVDLFDDSDDEDEDGADDDGTDDDDYNDKKMPPPPLRKPPAQEVVDLCHDDEDDGADNSNTVTQYACTTTTSRNKKRQRRQENKPKRVMPSSADVIEVNEEGHSKAGNNSPALDVSEQYRRALGPLRFDFCHNMNHHSFLKVKPVASLNNLCRELLEYKLNLPIFVSSSIFVRAMESRMDLLRAVITGPEDTPYANGCFFFDISLYDYPFRPPSVNFLTTAGGNVRFNPNLYKCGKVCLSLLGTWSGPAWQPNKSTLLQVLVSIQGLILVSDPYFNEPGFDRKTSYHNLQATQYNKNIRLYTVQHAICDILRDVLHSSSSSKQQHPQPKKNPYPEMKEVVMTHFEQRADAIMEQLRKWQAEDARLNNLVLETESLLNELKNQKLRGSSAPAAASAEGSEHFKVAVEAFPPVAAKPPPPAQPHAAPAPFLSARALSTRRAEPNDVVVID